MDTEINDRVSTFQTGAGPKGQTTQGGNGVQTTIRINEPRTNLWRKVRIVTQSLLT